jgi:hypothetical protein
MTFSRDLTSESLKKLLRSFSDDNAAAGAAYTKLRDSLVRFFALKGDINPGEAADETLDRVALKFSQNTEIADSTKYSFGVARLIFLERLKEAKKEEIAAKVFYTDRISLKPDKEIDEFSTLRECFNQLNVEEKTVLELYFADLPPAALCEQRKNLTIRHNITLNNLRLKVFRLRERLEKCVKNKKYK